MTASALPPFVPEPLPRERQRINANGVLCLQCWNRRPREEFGTNPRTRTPHTRCDLCKEKYAGWAGRTRAEKLALVRPFDSDDAYSVGWVPLTHNRKLGPIPVSRTARGSCPGSCSFKNAGCFAEVSWSRLHWEKVPQTGLSWNAFCRAVAALPEGQLWRHNEAGDLAGSGEAVDPEALRKLVRANTGRLGFTFTHKPVLADAPGAVRRDPALAMERGLWLASNREAIASAVRGKFAINLSADTLEDADRLADLGIAPVVVVVPHDAPDHATKTPGGRQVVVCPNETHAVTCFDCRLCAKPGRKSIIAFRAHGQGRHLVSEIVKTRRTP